MSTHIPLSSASQAAETGSVATTHRTVEDSFIPAPMEAGAMQPRYEKNAGRSVSGLMLVTGAIAAGVLLAFIITTLAVIVRYFNGPVPGSPAVLFPALTGVLGAAGGLGLLLFGLRRAY